MKRGEASKKRRKAVAHSPTIVSNIAQPEEDRSSGHMNDPDGGGAENPVGSHVGEIESICRRRIESVNGDKARSANFKRTCALNRNCAAAKKGEEGESRNSPSACNG